MKIRAVLSVFCFFWIAEAVLAEMPVILSMRDRAEVRDAWLERRLETVVPELMRRESIDMWIIASREYNEDPVFPSMAPATWLRARRRTILLFHDRGGDAGVERLAVSRYGVGQFFEAAWDPEKQPDQWVRLAELISERDPDRIAVNRSKTFALADGMTDTEFDSLRSALSEDYAGKLVSGEALAIGWLERRIPEEMAVYPAICRIAHRILAEGLSDAVIQPGVTTTEDVQWWYRERIRNLNLVTWFHPSVSVQRASDPEHAGSFASRPGEMVIQPGDLLHVDFGINYLGLNTDTQQHAYVLRPGERSAPQGIVEALRAGNRLQDILMSQFKTGASGNDILAGALRQAKAEGLVPSIYTHPLGFHGHGAGPSIGMWDMQDGVPGKGDYPLYADTAHSIELNVTVPISEWDGKKIRIMLEEDAFFDGSQARFIDGHQTEMILIGERLPD